MKRENIILMKRDQELLLKHVKDLNLTTYNRSKLLAELNGASVLDEKELPADTVRIQSAVEIQEKKSGKKYDFQIVLPSKANIKEKKVSVFSPIGIALIGYRAGAKIQWEMPDGIKTFTILDVRYK